MSRLAFDRSTRLRLVAVGAGLLGLGWVGLMTAVAPKRAPMPGPLASHHAPLGQDCDVCHAGSLTALQGLGHGFSSTALDLAQSERCLRCHDLGPHALAAHGMADSEWDPAPASSRYPGVPQGPQGELACSTCHVEHGGRGADLTQLDDRRCQACHTTPFGGFEEHPEFVHYPYRGRTHLIFDHRRHFDQHFAAEDAGVAPESCSDCHTPDRAGVGMPLTGYAAACAACHADDIRGTAQVNGAGLAFLALPAIDTYSLEEQGVEIEPWPADSFLVETPLTPFLELLLVADPEAESNLASLAGVDLLDLAQASADELQGVKRLVSDVRALFRELAEGGHVALLSRLESLRGGPLEDGAAQALLAQLPEALMRDVVQGWLPERAPEEGFEDLGSLDSDRAHEEWVSTGGWYVGEMDFSIRYRPSGHGDAFLRGWLELASSQERGRRAFESLSHRSAVGACGKCHGDRGGAGAGLHWEGSTSVSGGLTPFAHRPHLVNSKPNGCLECHVLGPVDDRYLEAFVGTPPGAPVSNFELLGVSDCAQCHFIDGAEADCLTCHAYHRRADSASYRSALAEVR